MKISIVNTSVACLREKLAKGIGLPFAQLLPESFLEKVLAEEKVNYRKRLFCPIVTLWAWTSQVLDADKSCKNALSRVISYLIAEELEPPSTNTSAYCQARSRSFTCFLSRLVRRIGNHLHSCVQSGWLWCGLKVFVVDGSTLQAADTVKNQKAYPQHKSQAKGCGFPMVRIVVRFCLSTGAVLDTAISAFSVGEVNLFRRLFANLQAGSRATGDRIFGTYADICLLKNRCVESAFRRHGARKTDFRRGKRLSKWDHLVHWEKPSRCPTGLSKKQFDLLPTQLLMREVRFYIQRRGFRTEDVTLVTTLLDPKTYSKQALAQLYGYRWHAELDIRHLKTTMKMDFLPSKTPEMVRKDFYVHLLAYNLIRHLQWEAGCQSSVKPIALSFKATPQHFRNFIPNLAYATEEQRVMRYRQLILLIASEKRLFRPNRVEPRVVKRRPKQYQRLNEPRQKLKRKCMNRKIDAKNGKYTPTY